MRVVDRGYLIGLFNEVMGTDFDNESGDIQKKDVASWDSFKMVELIIVLQNHYSISFEIGRLSELSSINEIVLYIESR